MSENGFDGTDLNKARQAVVGMISKWGLTAIVPAILVVLAVLAAANGGAFVFLFNLLFGFEKQHDFFYQTLGMNDAWSTVLARLMQFVTALGWVPLLVYFPLKRLDAKNIGVFLLGFSAIYVANPLLKAVAGSDVCFDQKTGTPIKWFVVENDGKITLYDSAGYDRSGVKKRLATTEICQTYYAQKSGVLPHPVNGDPHILAFFSPDGSPRIWFSREPTGGYRLFDAPGVDPNTGDKLMPVTRAVRDDIVQAAEQSKKQPERRATGPTRRHSANGDDETASGGRAEIPPPPRPAPEPQRWRYGCRHLPNGELACRE